MRNPKPAIVLLACGVLLLGVSCLQAQDWPQWRGPDRNAKATGFTAPKTWPKELTQKWKVTVGDGVATPALVGDKLYVFSREGGNEVLRCLNAVTGKELWQDKYPDIAASGPAGGFPGPRSSPTVAEGKVVTLGVNSTLSCYDAASGQKVWRKEDYKDYVPQFFTSCSPIVVDGLVVVQLGKDDDGAIMAYDLVTGNEKWKYTDDGTKYSSPVLSTVDGKKVIVAETASNIVGLDVTNGKRLWKTPFSAGYNAATPIVDGQKVIYSGGRRGAKPATKAVKIEKEGDALAAKELWNNPDAGVQYNTPVIKNGLVFGLSASDVFFCINEETGKTAWTAPKPGAQANRGGPPAGGGEQKRGGGQPGGRGRMGRGGRGGGGMMGTAGYGSIVDADSVLLALTPSMELIVFEPSDKEFKQLAKYKVATTATYAYPVVSGNRIYIKDKDSVILWTIE